MYHTISVLPSQLIAFWILKFILKRIFPQKSDGIPILHPALSIDDEKSDAVLIFSPW